MGIMLSNDIGLRHRVRGAVYYLAEPWSSRRQRERVIDAYRDYLSPLRPEAFPAAPRVIFEKLIGARHDLEHKVVEKTDPYLLEVRGSLECAKSYQYLSPQVARRLAKLICELDTAVQRAFEDELTGNS